MRTNAIIRIILFSLAIVVLLTILGVGIAARTWMADLDSPAEGNISSTGAVDADAVRTLSIDWVSGTITIRPADVDKLTLTETGADEVDPMVWVQSGDILKISYWKDEIHFPFGAIPSKDLLIEVPRDWICDTLKVETAAADLEAEEITIRKVDFDGASGVFHFDNCSVDALDVDTASGNIHFTGTLNTLDCDAASADCEIILTNCPSRIEMDMASGDLDLTLPEACGFTARMDALSGRLDSDFDITRTEDGFISGDGSCRIDISAMSGDVYIRKASES